MKGAGKGKPRAESSSPYQRGSREPSGRSQSKGPEGKAGSKGSSQRSRTAGPSYGGYGRGFTPFSEPVLSEQVLDALITPGSSGIYADCTFGNGGHSRVILNRLPVSAKLLVLDVDPSAIAEARKLAAEDSRVLVHHRAFSELEQVVASVGKELSGALFDLGVNESSERDHSRGLSYFDDTQCDLRMNPTLGEPAAEWLKRTNSDELAWIIKEFGDDEDPLIAARIAEGLVQHVKRRPFKTAREMAEYISRVKGGTDSKARHPAKGTFQAIRTYLNQEPQQMWAGFLAAFKTMKMGGRCVVITYNRWEMILARRFCRDFEDYDKKRALGWSLERLTQLYPLLTTDVDWAVIEVCSPMQATPQEADANKKARSARGLVFQKVPRVSQPSPAILHPSSGLELERLLFTRPEKIPVFQGEAEKLDTKGQLSMPNAVPNRAVVADHQLQTATAPPRIVQTIGEWLQEVGGKDGKLFQYQAAIEAKFSTVAAILQCTSAGANADAIGGRQYATFFTQVGIVKLGHRRLFQLWLSSQPLPEAGVKPLRRASNSPGGKGREAKDAGGKGRPRSREPAGKTNAQPEDHAVAELREYFASLQQVMGKGAGGKRVAAMADEEHELFGHASLARSPSGYVDTLLVERSGKDAEKVILFGPSFEDLFREFDVPLWLRRNLTRCHFSQPTQLQRHVLPYALIGRDVFITAPSGCGKTVAYLMHLAIALPEESAAANSIGRNGCYKGAAKPLALIIAPSREQCSAIMLEAKRLCFGSSFRLCSVYGGIGLRPQAATLAHGCDICVTTPGRFVDLVERQIMSLEAVSFLVLDEVSAMLDLNFEHQLRNIIETSGMPTSDRRQTIFAMAPQAVLPALRGLTKLTLYDHIAVEATKCTGGVKGIVSRSEVEQVLHWVSPEEKMERILDILSEKALGKTLVFVRRKTDATKLLKLLHFAGCEAAALHGEVPQDEREQIMSRFRLPFHSGPTALHTLIATDIVVRGLDVPKVWRVINYDLPATLDEYLRRIRRTDNVGCRAIAISFFVSRGEDENLGIAQGLLELMRMGNFPVPEGLEDEVNARCVVAVGRE